jgi:hypothetical protein
MPDWESVGSTNRLLAAVYAVYDLRLVSFSSRETSSHCSSLRWSTAYMRYLLQVHNAAERSICSFDENPRLSYYIAVSFKS